MTETPNLPLREGGRLEAAVNLESVQRVFRKHLAIYRHRKPLYQTVMLRQIAKFWENHKYVLDIGGGTGVVGQAIQELFDVSVTSIDIEDRFVEGLSIKTSTFDGRIIPFEDASFDAIILNNVLHHVPVSQRDELMLECRRVCGGPVYIKDHITTSRLDYFRLTILDLIGNIPFSGMLSACYLADEQWLQLAASTGYVEIARESTSYRSGLLALAFPNRLEITMKWEPLQ